MLVRLKPFTAFGTLKSTPARKPGWLRTGIVALTLFIVNLAARTLYTRGRLARIYTIHSARWVPLDNRTRMYFASNYDGSLESYMDDFINKAGFGLNLSFSSAIGYPQTDWLVRKGAWREQDFKRFQRRHQILDQVLAMLEPGGESDKSFADPKLGARLRLQPLVRGRGRRDGRAAAAGRPPVGHRRARAARGMAGRVDQQAFLHLHLLVVGHAHLARRHQPAGVGDGDREDQPAAMSRARSG